MIDFSHLDFSAFEDVPAPVRYFDRPKLSVGVRGTVTLSRSFLGKLGDARDFRIKIGKDGRHLVLWPDVEGDIHFSPKGVMTHPELKEKIESYGFLLPARYVFEWYEKEQVWVGVTEELPPPPKLEAMIPPRRRRRKNAA